MMDRVLYSLLSGALWIMYICAMALRLLTGKKLISFHKWDPITFG